MTKLLSLEQAGKYFVSNLKEKPVTIKKQGYVILIKTIENKYCVCFKKEYYKNFQFHFSSLGRVGWGQIGNKTLLEFCKENNYNYIAVMPDGKIYQISPSFWLDYYNRFHTDVPHLNGEIAIPLKFFKNFIGD